MDQKNILIFGGELQNKGAQAMTFITVDEAAKRFPDHKVILYSPGDKKRIAESTERYTFEIHAAPYLKGNILMMIARYVPFLKFFIRQDVIKNTIDDFRNADYVFDISGYALSSDWSEEKSIGYCLRAACAKLYGAGAYLLPQSFGPFDYKGKKAKITDFLIKKTLGKLDLIMAREQAGYDLLKEKYGFNNVVKTYDMVLENRGIDIENVFKAPPEMRSPEIAPDSVGIIPNIKTLRFGKQDDVFSDYDIIVDELSKAGKHVYFISHSLQDKELCETLYKRYSSDRNNISLIRDELNCLEFDAAVSKLDFIIGSRYHAIVHAYRNKVPAVVLGWAVKYKELLGLFGQERYQFNVRKAIDPNELRNAISAMTSDHKKESEAIGNKLTEIRKENIFDLIR